MENERRVTFFSITLTIFGTKRVNWIFSKWKQMRTEKFIARLTVRWRRRKKRRFYEKINWKFKIVKFSFFYLSECHRRDLKNLEGNIFGYPIFGSICLNWDYSKKIYALLHIFCNYTRKNIPAKTLLFIDIYLWC